MESSDIDDLSVTPLGEKREKMKGKYGKNERDFAHSEGRVLLATYLIIKDRTRDGWAKGEHARPSHKKRAGAMSKPKRRHGMSDHER